MNEQSYYETMYILRPDIAEDEVTSHIDKYNKLLKDFGGTILDSQMRGKRRLAYQIAKHRRYLRPTKSSRRWTTYFQNRKSNETK